MKLLRLVVVVLLAVLLPVRGAVAGAMWCGAAHGAAAVHGAASNAPDAMAHGSGAPHAHDTGHPHGDAPHDHGASHGKPAAHADTSASHHAAAEPPSGPTAADTCQFCASGCCMASIVAAVPSIGPAPLSAAAHFPPLLVPAPTFVSGGLERPPRAG